MSWRAITEDDVYGVLNDVEATALRASLLRAGQADPLTTLIAQVTGHCRDAIRSHDANRLDPDPTFLPEGVIPMAVDIVVYRLGQRLSRALPLTEDRKEAKAAAEAYLDKVAKGQREVEQYGVDESSTPVTGTMEQLTPNRRRADREGLKGL